jgi:MFS family permease
MTVATVIFAWAPTVEVLIVARFVQGFASGSIWTASMSWVTDNAPPDRRGRESGIVMGFLSAGSVAGPGIGALAASAGSALAFGMVAAISALGVVLAWIAPTGRLVVADAHLFESIRRGARQRATIAAMTVNLIDLLAFSSVDLLVPLQLGASGTSVGTIAVAFAGGAALGAIAGPVGGRIVDRSGAARVGLVMGVCIMVTPFVLATQPSEAVQLALLVIGGVLFSVMGASMFPLSSLGADQAGVPHVTVMGLMGAVWAAGSSVMPLLLGSVAQATSNSVAFLLAGVLCLTAVLVLARNVRLMRPVPTF